MADALRAFSLARQSVQKDDGIAHQRRMNRSTIEMRGWKLAFDEFDNNVSASKARGPGTAWFHALEAWDRHEYDVLVVTRIDRLIRDVYSKDLGDIVDRHMLVCVGGLMLDLSDPYQQSMFAMQAVNATQEVRGKEFRRAPVISAARAAGHPSAGVPPLGYRWIDTSERRQISRATGVPMTEVRRYQQEPEEARIVVEIADRVLAGEPLGSIRRIFQARGLRTRQGKDFGPTSLARAVLNPVVAGLLPPVKAAGEQNPRTVDVEACAPGNWDPILEVSRWRAVRGVLLDEARRTNGGSTARSHLLSGIAQCGQCFRPMRSHVNRHRAPIYRCSSLRHNSRLAGVLDDYIEDLAVARLIAPDARGFLQRRDGLDIDQLRAERAEWVRRKGEVTQALVRGLVTAEQMVEPVRTFDMNVARIDSALRAANALDPLAPLVGASDVRGVWRSLTVSRRQQALKVMMTITIHPLGPGGRARTSEELQASVTIGWNVDGADVEDVDTVLLRTGDLVPAFSDGVRTSVAEAVHQSAGHGPAGQRRP